MHEEKAIWSYSTRAPVSLGILGHFSNQLESFISHFHNCQISKRLRLACSSLTINQCEKGHPWQHLRTHSFQQEMTGFFGPGSSLISLLCHFHYALKVQNPRHFHRCFSHATVIYTIIVFYDCYKNWMGHCVQRNSAVDPRRQGTNDEKNLFKIDFLKTRAIAWLFQISDVKMQISLNKTLLNNYQVCRDLPSVWQMVLIKAAKNISKSRKKPFASFLLQNTPVSKMKTKYFDQKKNPRSFSFSNLVKSHMQISYSQFSP